MGCVMAIGLRIKAHNEPKEEAMIRQSITVMTKDKHFKSKHLSHNIIGCNSSRDIRDFYEIEEGPILGTGVSGSVKVCVHRKTKLQFALKRLNKQQLKPEKLAQLRVEIAIMTGLDHPNILRLHEFFETDAEIYLILELCRGGELLDRLHEQTNHRYSERVACKLIFTMMSAVRYCHANSIVHRDLKLENFLFESEQPDSQLKLIGEKFQDSIYIN
jgi:calcium-dependent protein kinase